MPEVWPPSALLSPSAQLWALGFCFSSTGCLSHFLEDHCQNSNEHVPTDVLDLYYWALHSNTSEVVQRNCGERTWQLHIQPKLRLAHIAFTTQSRWSAADRLPARPATYQQTKHNMGQSCPPYLPPPHPLSPILLGRNAQCSRAACAHLFQVLCLSSANTWEDKSSVTRDKAPRAVSCSNKHHPSTDQAAEATRGQAAAQMFGRTWRTHQSSALPALHTWTQLRRRSGNRTGAADLLLQALCAEQCHSRAEAARQHITASPGFGDRVKGTINSQKEGSFYAGLLYTSTAKRDDR